MGELVPLGIKDTRYSISVSLRGSLAGQYCQIAQNESWEDAEEFLKGLLYSSDDRLLKIVDEEKIVIGYHRERGMYFPDW